MVDEENILGSLGNSLWYLRVAARKMESIDGGACGRLLEIGRFSKWPASTSKHHAWEGGLAQHTAEVLRIALGLCDAASAAAKPLDREMVICAAIFHDAGKIHDYDRLEPTSGGKAVWLKSDHYDLIHHVVKSSEMWDRLSGTGIDPAFSMGVKHCILAHHGRLEWGSPVLPRTREAWAVHLADMASVHCIEERKP